MAKRRKWLKLAIGLLALVVVAQAAVGLLVRTRRVHAYLIGRLERAFGRQVDVRQFDAQVFPKLRLEANGITVGEDPAFGNEYFLRAEQLTAGLRWPGLLGGHFEFGTLSMSRPSLILVRNAQGRWNLEDWLPPAKSGDTARARIYGPPAAAGGANRLRKIKFDDGRVNFKSGQDKRPFAFVNVSGSVEQVSPGRWQLQLEAQPWRSGVPLQSAGTLRVRGDIAGTSARLQPAQFTVHWTQASLADLLRLLRGQDYGVRGSFSLEASAHSGAPEGGEGSDAPGKISGAGASKERLSEDAFGRESSSDWSFALEARMASVHRWDLTERADNPRLSLKLGGRANLAARTVDAAEMALVSPTSNLHGSLHFAEGVPAVQVKSASIQATDLLAWWRAFEPGVDDGIAVDQYFTGAGGVHGWPPSVDELTFSSDGGSIKIPGIAEPVWIGAVRGGGAGEKLAMEPVRVRLGGERNAVVGAGKRRNAPPLRDAGDLTASEDFAAHEGGLAIDGEVEQIATLLRAAAAIGRPLQHGWDMDGRAVGFMQWDWNRPSGQRWSGKIALSKAHLAVAGLNQQLQVENAACVWENGLRSVFLGAVDGFGTSWSGTLRENPSADGDAQARWNFSLHGTELSAAEIDRWVGPRARPGWLQTLLHSLGGSSSDGAAENSSGNLAVPSGTAASELVRRMDAQGEVTLDRLTIEKLQLANVRVVGRLHGLQLEASDVAAQWAGGKVHGQFSAKFSPRPAYEFIAQLDGASLAQLPVQPNISDRWSGAASGSLHLTTKGVGREELLRNLAGQGKVSLRNVEFRGWDVGASVADGAAHEGTSQWSAGSAAFTLVNRKLLLDNMRLDGAGQFIYVSGTVDFAQEAELALKAVDGDQPAPRSPLGGRTLKVSGPLDDPLVRLENAVARSSASTSTATSAP
jgi:hypothetical protein